MKKIGFLFIGIVFCGHLAAQEVVFKPHRLHFRTSYERLKMSGEPDLGMVGIGADLFIVDKLPNFYLTLNSYSAIVGNRPGLISFGTGAGYTQPLFRSPLSLDAGVFIGGGGGGGAPDGGGIITRGHLNLSYQWKSVSVFGGYSRLDFPTGDMGSSNINVGISLSSVFHTANRRAESTPASESQDSQAQYARIRVNLLGLQYLHFAGKPTLDNGMPVPQSGDIHLIGIELDRFFHEKWYAALKLHGAVAGGIDGYMSYLLGLGFEQALGTERLKMDAQFLAGPSGGGNIASGGGGTLQAALGLRASLGKDYTLKASLGQTISPGGSLNGTFLEIGLAQHFDFISPDYSSGRGSGPRYESGYRMQTSDQWQHFGMEIQNRTYFSPDLPDKNGIRYDRSFNLLGFQLSKRISQHLDALGATYWAYQGSYGAYAEGLLGLRYHRPFSPVWAFQAQVLAGAAGGAGIDLGSGLVFQYSAGLHRKLSDHWGITLNAGKMQGFQGNFNPYFLDLGIAYRFSQLSSGHK